MTIDDAKSISVRDLCEAGLITYGQQRCGGGLYPRVPQLNQRPPRLTAPEMFVAVKYGIRYTEMGAWNDEITDQEI